MIEPRSRGYTHLPLVVVGVEDVLTEDGTLVKRGEWCSKLDEQEPSIVVCMDAERLVSDLDKLYRVCNDRWRWRATVYDVDDGLGRCVSEKVTVLRFGFSAVRGGKGKWFPVLDVSDFLEERFPLSVYEMYQLGSDVRAFMRQNDLPIQPSRSGIASALLRDERFYPDTRRKVPLATNVKLKPHLPGNFYQCNAELGWPYDAIICDQQSAHHAAAAAVSLPSSNDLYAFGYFQEPDAGRAWIGHPQGMSWFLNHFMGMVCAVAKVPYSSPFLSSVAEHPLLSQTTEQRVIYFSTNEWPYLARHGVELVHLVAAWASTTPDEGLKRYALWSMTRNLNSKPERRRWLKPTLLAAYGLLASCGSRKRSLSNVGKGQRYETTWLVGYGDEKITNGGLANVAQRAMIEAEVRQRSLDLAENLDAAGLKVLAIYADALLIDSHNIPLVPAPWRYQQAGEAIFLNEVSYVFNTGEGLTAKLPGLAGDLRVQAVNTARKLLQARGGHS